MTELAKLLKEVGSLMDPDGYVPDHFYGIQAAAVKEWMEQAYKKTGNNPLVLLWMLQQ